MTDITENELRDAERIKAFLADEIVQTAIENLRQKYYQDFKTSVSPELRNDAWACARAIDDFENELRAVVENGVAARARLDKQQR